MVSVAAIATLIPYQSSLAQAPVDLRLTVAQNSQARSATFDIGTSSELRVRLEQPPSSTDGVVRVYVFDQTGVLRGLDDPDVDAEVFVWHPSDAGRYFVLVLNTNSSPVAVRIGSVEMTRGPTSRGAHDFATVRILFATNRQPASDVDMHFGSEPSAEMSYGYCDVSIPRDHRMGQLEAPSIWRLEFKEDPDKHVTLLAIKSESSSAFFKHVADRVSQSAKKEAFVFVHGFNVTFNDAAKRTAQIAYDLAFDGPAILFSWPSQGSLLSYTSDQRNADLSAQSLEEFLFALKGNSRQLTVHLIAHSMGNRVLTRALEHLGAGGDGRGTRPLREVAMMAPDIDAALFRQLAGKIAASAEHVTLYASSQDLALRTAQRVAGGYSRAGEGGPGIVVVPGIDTIDASTVDTSILGLSHGYYADNSTILSDLFALIRGRRPNDRFRLQPIKSKLGNYWEFRPAVR